MSATERLRELLDDRGVKHEGSERSVRWRDRNGVIMQAFPLTSGELGLEVWSCTPEQAIAATLGTGTCHISVNDNLAETEGMGDVWLECDACGWQMPLESSTPRFNFCPNCGAKVVGQ